METVGRYDEKEAKYVIDFVDFILFLTEKLGTDFSRPSQEKYKEIF